MKRLPIAAFVPIVLAYGGGGLISLVAAQDPLPLLAIRADFDRGSIGELREIAPGHLRGPTRHWVEPGGNNDQRYWFYFRLDHVRDRDVTIELTDMIGLYRGERHGAIITEAAQPVFSYDRVSWDRIADTHWDPAVGTWHFRQRFEKSPVWIAYAHPFPLETATRWLASLAQRPGLQQEEIGRSRDGRPISMLTVGAKDAPQTILITALAHPGEDAGGYFIQGLVESLLGDEEHARGLRERTLFKIVPVLNPDGLFRGHSRLNANLIDLNSAWRLPADGETVEPEIAAMRGWMEQWRRAGRRIDLHFDVHCSGQRFPEHILVVRSDAWLAGPFAGALQCHFPLRVTRSRFAGSIAEYTSAHYGARTATVELTQGRYGEERPRYPHYLTLEDYHRVGAQFLLALATASPLASHAPAGESGRQSRQGIR